MRAAHAVAHGLRIVDDRAEQLLRAQRIDALGVDRTVFARYPVPRWSPEAEAREPAWRQLRSDVTLGERIAVWRVWFARNR